MDKRTLAAYAIGYHPKDILGFSQIDENHFKVIGPHGEVHYLTDGDLQRAAMQITPPVPLPEPTQKLETSKLKTSKLKTSKLKTSRRPGTGKVQKGRAKK